MFWQGIMYDVTRQRESEALARETETRYRALVEQLPAIVYSESVKEGAHDLTYINSRVEEILGATPAEWLADPVGSWLGHIHPDDRDAVEQENLRSDRTGEPFVAEYRMTTADDRIVVDPRRGRAGPRRAGQPEVLAGRDDRHHGAARGRDQPGGGGGTLPRAGRADADDHLPGLAERAAVHAVHEPADHVDPRLHAAGLVRRRRPVRQAGAPRRRGARGARARVGGRARRHVPHDRQGRPDRLDPRPGAPDPGRRGQAEVLAGRADRHHRAPALAGAGARPDAGARGRATPPRRRRDEEHVPAGRLARPPDAARRASWAWPSRWRGTTWSSSRTRCATWRGGSPRTPASSTGSSPTCSTWTG